MQCCTHLREWKQTSPLCEHFFRLILTHVCAIVQDYHTCTCMRNRRRRRRPYSQSSIFIYHESESSFIITVTVYKSSFITIIIKIIISSYRIISVSRQSRKMISNQTTSVIVNWNRHRWNALICHVSNHITIWYAEETYSFSESLYVSQCYCTLHKNTQLRALSPHVSRTTHAASACKFRIQAATIALDCHIIQKARAILDTAL